MNFVFALVFCGGMDLSYIIHFQKVDLSHRIKLLDGVDSTLLYVDPNHTIHRMQFTGTTLNYLYPVNPGFSVKRLGIRNQNEAYGNGFYLASGTHDMLLLEMVNFTHESIRVQSVEEMLTTTSALQPWFLSYFQVSGTPQVYKLMIRKINGTIAAKS